MHARFPPQNDSRLQAWINSCKRADPINPETARVCSQHFLPDDFELNFRKELLGTKSRKRLKSSTIPTLFLRPPTSTGNSEARKERHQRREAHTLADSILATFPVPPPPPPPQSCIMPLLEHIGLIEDRHTSFVNLVADEEMEFYDDSVAQDQFWDLPNFSDAQTCESEICEQTLSDKNQIIARLRKKIKSLQVLLHKVSILELIHYVKCNL